MLEAGPLIDKLMEVGAAFKKPLDLGIYFSSTGKVQKKPRK